MHRTLRQRMRETKCKGQLIEKATIWARWQAFLVNGVLPSTILQPFSCNLHIRTCKVHNGNVMSVCTQMFCSCPVVSIPETCQFQDASNTYNVLKILRAFTLHGFLYHDVHVAKRRVIYRVCAAKPIAVWRLPQAGIDSSLLNRFAIVAD